jgi:Domain of unknown function (DUF222)
VEFWLQPAGMASMVAVLPADGMASLRAVLDAAAAGMKVDHSADPRTVDQRRADALVELARRSLDSGRLAGAPDGQCLPVAHGHRPSIQVTVAWSTLIGLDDQPGELAGYGPIPASVARRIAAGGVWRRLLTDPAGGALLDYGTTRYQPPLDLADHVIARDRTCIFASCAQPAYRCQLDHTIASPHGPTSAGNLGPMCHPHHNGKTHGGWHVEQPEPGRFHWRSPTGHTYTIQPCAIGPIIEPPPDPAEPDHAPDADHTLDPDHPPDTGEP